MGSDDALLGPRTIRCSVAVDECSTVEPQSPRFEHADRHVVVFRPRVLGQLGADVHGIRAVDEVRGVLPVAHRAAQDNQSRTDQAIHERGVLGPAALLADVAGVVPSWAVNERAEKVRHNRTVGRRTDSGWKAATHPSSAGR
jgi:hypothetical protein